MTGDIIIRSEDIIENLFVIKKGTVSIEFTTAGNTLEDEIIVRSFGFFGGQLTKYVTSFSFPECSKSVPITLNS